METGQNQTELFRNSMVEGFPSTWTDLMKDCKEGMKEIYPALVKMPKQKNG